MLKQISSQKTQKLNYHHALQKVRRDELGACCMIVNEL